MVQTEFRRGQAERGTFRFETASLTGLHWLAIILAAVTGAIHLYLFVTDEWIPLLLAGLGFFGSIGLLFVLPDYRKYLYPAGILYTIAQIVGYVFGPKFGPEWIAYVDKAVQVVFILLLAYFTYEEWA